MYAGPAIGIGELGHRLGRQMRWGRPLVAPLISQLKYTTRTEKGGGAGRGSNRQGGPKPSP